MSQRECAGLNWPGFSIDAGEPFRTSPPISNSPLRLPLLLVCPPSIALGVGHAAAAAIAGKSDPGPFRFNSFIAPRCERAPFSPSVPLAVGQAAHWISPRGVCQLAR